MKHFDNLYNKLQKMENDVKNNKADIAHCNQLLFHKYFRYYPVKMLMPSTEPSWNKQQLVGVLSRICGDIRIINGL